MYQQTIPVLYNTSRQNINEYVRKRYGVPDVLESSCGGATITLTGSEVQFFLVWMEKFKNDPFYVSLLCHEMNHLAMAVLRSAGVVVTPEGEEALTYLQQYYVRTFMEKAKRKR